MFEQLDAKAMRELLEFIAKHGRRVDVSQQIPIVHGARHQVECLECGASFASAKETPDEALAEVRAAHEPRHAAHLVADTVNLAEHPVYAACRCRRCRHVTGRP